MKILFLTRRFWPEIGGVEKHTLEVAKRLVKAGHKVAVISETPFSKQTQQNLRPKIQALKAYRIPADKDNWFKKFRIWRWLWENRVLIHQAEIVHAHDVGFWYWPFRILFPKKPFFITFHGWEGKFPLPFKNKLIRKVSEKLAWGNICVGDYLKKWYGTRPDYVIYGGVSNSFPTPHLPKSKSLIVFVGRLEKDTGLPIYLKAVAQLALNNLTQKIIFLGDGPLRRKAEKYGHVLGFVKEIQPYLYHSRFVFTAGYLSILKAMVCQRLVFAVYDNPLKKDYLKMAPFAKWIVAESDPRKLAKKIKYYLDHPHKERNLTKKAYKWAKKQDWGKVVEVYLRLWKK